MGGNPYGRSVPVRKKPSKNEGSVINKIRIYTDGASRGNPGPAGIGVLIQDENEQPIKKIRRFLGTATNNVAEYTALIEGLEAVKKLKPRHLEVFSDSELVIKQMKGEYQVRNPNLFPLYQRAKVLMNHFHTIQFYSIPREMNRAADALANEAIDHEFSRVPKPIR